MTNEERQAKLDRSCKGVELTDEQCLKTLKGLICDKENEIIFDPRYEEAKQELYALKRVTAMFEKSLERSRSGKGSSRPAERESER